MRVSKQRINKKEEVGEQKGKNQWLDRTKEGEDGANRLGFYML